MENENIIRGLDGAIGALTQMKKKVIKDNLTSVDVKVIQNRDIAPHYELGSFEPTGFKVVGPETIEILVSNSSDTGKVI